MGDLDDRDIILGLIQKTEEEVSLIAMKRDGKIEYNLVTEKFTEIVAEFTRVKTQYNQEIRKIWKMRYKSSRTLIRDKRREPNCIKIERDKIAE